jgi:hypothetical protein
LCFAFSLCPMSLSSAPPRDLAPVPFNGRGYLCHFQNVLQFMCDVVTM